MVADSDREKLAVLTRFPTIYWAHWVFEQANNNQPIRWGIEARLMAGQTNEEIARVNGCLPGVIEAFESLFFNFFNSLFARRSQI